MNNRIALVTGANGGLGTQVTKAFLDAGYTVVGLSPRIAQSDFCSPNFIALPASITNLQSAQQAIAGVIQRSGQIDVLAHLVGGYAGGKTIDQTDDATWHAMFDVNLNSAFHLLRAVIPEMRKAGGGRIIGIGSRAAEQPWAKTIAYNASKAAFVSLMKTAALENKDAGITVNAILPGTIDTPANRRDIPKADTSQWVQPASI
ncbi:MAG TPA: SDR family NAD(P)-dependent oxidoreductase, partial [Candidatus Binatia bacterium]|nr:SDR family NAD(P)-dependent oxidoreductase [Candidatus Binatia bacterium]